MHTALHLFNYGTHAMLTVVVETAVAATDETDRMLTRDGVRMSVWTETFPTYADAMTQAVANASDSQSGLNTYALCQHLF